MVLSLLSSVSNHHQKEEEKSLSNEINPNMKDFPILSWGFVDLIDSSVKANVLELVKCCFELLSS